jgi:hypothetical protein
VRSAHISVAILRQCQTLLQKRCLEAGWLLVVSLLLLIAGLGATGWCVIIPLALVCSSAMTLVRHRQMGAALAEANLIDLETHSGFEGMVGVALLGLVTGSPSGVLAVLGLTGILSTQAALRHDRQLLDFIRETIKAPIVREFPIPRASLDVPVITGMAHASRAAGRCAICSSSMEKAVSAISCHDCDTPYHADCWSYNGGCAIYGCGQRRKARLLAVTH